jgi:hypothetical protein
MGLFGDLDIRLEPWEVDYGSEVPFQPPSEVSDENVVLDLETPADAWEPIEPTPRAAPKRLVFVDGVRRMEARLIGRRGDAIFRGAFGSYAVGCVTVVRGKAEIGDVRTDRIVATGSGEIVPEPVNLTKALAYRPLSTDSSEVDAPLQLIQEQMRLGEERMARERAEEADTLVVADGPLTFGERVRGEAVGYVKRLYKLYIDRGSAAEHNLDLLSRLPAGMRTPLFGLRSSGRFARYSWFLRLLEPYRGESPLSGIVRLEVAEASGVDPAKRLADWTAATLPRFAPGRGRDPRSPQNLLPIGALESRLRRQLGDPRLIRRHIGALLATMETS